MRVGAGLAQVLASLLDATGGAVALISGRAVSDVDALFAPLVFPAAGQHGAERRQADGTYHRHTGLTDALRPAARALEAFAARRPGVLLEDKGMSLALHFRRRPDLGEAVAAEMRRVVAGLGEAWTVQAGQLVYELRPGGRDKGMAIGEFMAEPPFAGRAAVFLGDDLTDEHGFAVVNRHGGVSVKVGPGESVARWRLRDAAAVRLWLAGCAERLDRRRAGERA